jgi:hypothetical protein
MGKAGRAGGVLRAQGRRRQRRVLLGVEIMTQERRYYEQGKQMLVAAVATEESQARARRAAYRTLELAGETVEPLQLRKALGQTALGARAQTACPGLQPAPGVPISIV